jgi:hypothetical protein
MISVNRGRGGEERTVVIRRHPDHHSVHTSRSMTLVLWVRMTPGAAGEDKRATGAEAIQMC